MKPLCTKILWAAFAGSSSFILSSASTSSQGAVAIARAPSLASIAVPASLQACSRGVIDLHNPVDCIPASRTPTLGALFPISTELFVSPAGNVGVGTTVPSGRLEVLGSIVASPLGASDRVRVRPSTSASFGVVETLHSSGSVTTLTSTVTGDPSSGAVATFRSGTLLTSLTSPIGDSNSGFVGVHNNGIEIAGINGSTGIVFGTSKAFVQPHPYDATKEIRYVSLEGPEHGVYVRGTAHLSGGQAVIELPESFRLVARAEGVTVSITPLGANRGLYVASKSAAEIDVRENDGGTGDVEFDFLVMGERSALPRHEAVVANTHFAPAPGANIPDERLPGSYHALMVQNGTLDADGSVNEANALTLGWRNEGGRWVGREHGSASLAEQPEAASGR